MAKYGEFEYGAMTYGKTVLVGEGVISPEGKVLSKIKVFVVNVGEAIVSPVTSLVRNIAVSVGMAGTVTSKYATFKYGEKPYGVDAHRPTSSLSRSIDIHRNVGEGIVSPVARAAKMLVQNVGEAIVPPVTSLVRNIAVSVKVGDGAVSIVGTLSYLLYAWLRGDIIGRLRKRDDLKGRIKR